MKFIYSSSDAYLLIFLIFLCFEGFTQKNGYSCISYGIGTYEYSATSNNDEPKRSVVMNMIEDALNDMTYSLVYGKQSSIFKLNKKLIVKNEFAYQMASVFGGNENTILYKNTEEKIKIKQTESMGEIFLIEYPYDEYEWEITKESKLIQGFNCYKAISYKEEYDYGRNQKNIFRPEVWFTPEISAPFGPIGLDGLPGLVLEGTINSKIYFHAVKIIFDCKDAEFELKKPSKGIKISQEKYSKTLAEKRPVKNR